MRGLAIALLLLAIARPAGATDDAYACFGAARYSAQAYNLTCDDCRIINAYVAVYGRARALAWAIGQGYAPGKISVARKCPK